MPVLLSSIGRNTSLLAMLLFTLSADCVHAEKPQDFADPATGTAASGINLKLGSVRRTLQEKLRDLPRSPNDYNNAAEAMGAGGMFSQTEGASGDVWYWGRNLSGAKSSGAGPNNLGWGPAGFQFDVRNDSSDAGGDFVRALYGRTVFGGRTARGGRIGVLGEALHNLGPTQGNNSNRNYVGVVGTAHSENGDGGSNTGNDARGAYFGLNGIGRLAAGASNVLEVTGAELNTYTKAGSSAKYILGATIVGFNETQGSAATAALEIGGGSDAGFGPHIGWKHGILFSNLHGANPMSASGSLLGSYWTDGVRRPITHGVDLSGFNVSGALIQGGATRLTENALSLGVNGANISTIQAGQGATAANLDLNAKGGGAVRVSTGNLLVGNGPDDGSNVLQVQGSARVQGAVLSAAPTGGVGYRAGAGGNISQTGGKSTPVSLNTVTGRITLSNEPLAAGATTCFTLQNSSIGPYDVIARNIAAGARPGAYSLDVDAVNAGSARFCLYNHSTTPLAEAVVISFAVIRGAIN